MNWTKKHWKDSVVIFTYVVRHAERITKNKISDPKKVAFSRFWGFLKILSGAVIIVLMKLQRCTLDRKFVLLFSTTYLLTPKTKIKNWSFKFEFRILKIHLNIRATYFEYSVIAQMMLIVFSTRGKKIATLSALVFFVIWIWSEQTALVSGNYLQKPTHEK